MAVSYKTDFSIELNFTETYKRYHSEHIAIRESLCLREQFPAVLGDIHDDDLFAGRISWGDVGLSTQSQAGDFGYFCNEKAVKKAMDNPDMDEAYRDKLRDMVEFWRTENTTAKVIVAFPPEMAKILPIGDCDHEPGTSWPIFRMAGTYLDYRKLIRLGIPGLKEEVARYKERAEKDGGDVKLYEGMLMNLDIAAETCLYYAKQAKEFAAIAPDTERANQLLQMAQTLEKISANAPENFRQAMQLTWIYSVLCSAIEYGRMDVYLGDFLAKDLDAEKISADDALKMTQSIWRLINSFSDEVDGRVIVGGLGRDNEENADRFALIAMEASRTVIDMLPQLTLRFYEGMNPALMEKALDVIAEGRTFPLLYNDDVHVPATQKAFDISRAEAEQYVMLGCGEFEINHRSFGTPSGCFNLLKTLEVTLRNGTDPVSGKVMGLQTGHFRDFETFEQLWQAYTKQIDIIVEMQADHEELEYVVTGKEIAYNLISILYDDCLERGKPMFAGGVRYLGGTFELYGNVNTADSLTAIKLAVYDDKRFTPDELIKMMDANFEGYEKERRVLEAYPKYGNDNDVADGMLVKLHEYVCNKIRDQKHRTNLHSYLAVIINNQQNTTLGRRVCASADGRLAFKSMANANNPFGGNDTQGVTAMLNSLVKPRVDIHAGSVQNMRFTKRAFSQSRPKIEALLKTYFKNGGCQAMITVINKGDLEKALVNPEKYKDVFVRVGGFSARFVELAKDVQQEVLSRVTYE